MRVTRAAEGRSAPDGEATVVGALAKGQLVPKLSARAGWVQVAYADGSAWVPAAALAPDQAEVWEVNTSWLNVRDRPGVTRPVVGGLPRSARVVPVASYGAWRRVAFGERSGWVFGSYLHPLPQSTTGASLYGRLLSESRAAGSSMHHLLLLDRGLANSPMSGQTDDAPERLASPSSGPQPSLDPFPARGEVPHIDPSALDFLHPWVKQACVVVLGLGDRVTARWFGRDAFVLEQCWSATKYLQAINLIVRANRAAPDLDLDAAKIREAGTSGGGLGVSSLLRSIVSYEDGVGSSNAGAATLGRLLPTGDREELLSSFTGRTPRFSGRYGLPELVRRPELVGPDGEVILRAPRNPGPSGPNLLSVYHLIRPLVMSTWHLPLEPDQRLPGAQWASLEGLARAMGHDSARYVDVGLEELGWARFRSPVVLSKLGFGVRSATGLPEIVYVAAVQVDDTRTTPPTRRAFALALRATHSDPVALDARVGAEVAELVQRVVDGRLR
jgi:uncharacterized protein YraI